MLTEQGDSIDVYEELLSGFSAMDVGEQSSVYKGIHRLHPDLMLARHL